MALSRAVAYAGALREELGVKGRVDLVALATNLALSVRELKLDGCEGALLRNPSDTAGIIVVNSSIRDAGRKRFTIAHEIGHRVIHRAAAACIPGEIGNWSNVTKLLEREADEFAAELLIPHSELAPLVNRQKPSLAVIEDAADEYAASLSASAWRYCEVADLPVAVIWSTDEVTQWCRKSDSFGFFLPTGKRLPEQSYAAAAHRGESVPPNPEPVPADEWIESDRLLENAEIWEHSMALKSYNSVLTLLWIKRDIAKTQDSENALLHELDPEEFTLKRKRWPGKR